jgi:hypothetical protein
VPDLWARIGLGEAVGELVIGRPGVRFEAFGDDVERARKERRGGLARDLADVAWSSLRAPQWRRALRDPGPRPMRCPSASCSACVDNDPTTDLHDWFDSLTIRLLPPSPLDTLDAY